MKENNGSGFPAADPRISFAMGDITKLAVDAIVNAANSTLLGGGGVDGAIHRAAGPKLKEECRGLNGCRTGEAKITKGYLLPAKHVIHTVGPKIWEADAATCERQLRDCYVHSLELAAENGLHSIAFPAISTGAYGYPRQEAAFTALRAVSEWLAAHPSYEMQVILVCMDRGTRECYQYALDKGL